MNNNKLFKNYILNTTYQILVLLAPIITTPYVSRILGAGGVGEYSYCQSIASYFVLFGAVGTTLYGQRKIAYCQADRAKRSDAFWEIEIFRMLAICIATVIFYMLFCRTSEYVVLYRILALEVLAAAFDISWLYMGLQEFKATVLRNSIIKVIGIVLVFLLVKEKKDVPLYTICLTLPILLGNLSLWFRLKEYVDIDFGKIGGRIRAIPSHLKSILILFVPQIAMEVYLVLDKTMIGLLGSSIEQVGYYTQAQKLITVILRIVTSLGTVMLPLMASIYAQGDREKINRNIQLSFRFTLLLSCGLMFGVIGIAPVFIPLFLGEGFDAVVSLVYVIAPIMVIIGISNVLGNQYLLPTMKEKAYTFSIVAGAGINLILNLILIPRFDAVGASVATVAAEGAVALVQCLYVKKEIDLRKALSPGIKYVFFGVGVFLWVRCLHVLALPIILGMILQIITGAVVYGLLLVLSRDQLVLMFMDKVLKNKT